MTKIASQLLSISASPLKWLETPAGTNADRADDWISLGGVISERVTPDGGGGVGGAGMINARTIESDNKVRTDFVRQHAGVL